MDGSKPNLDLLITTLLSLHLNTKGQRMQVPAGTPLHELYKWLGPVVVMKSTQTGISEWAVLTTFALAELGLSHFYVLPNEQIRNRFIDTRVDGLALRVPYYRQKLGTDADNKSLKSYAGAYMAFVGSNSAAVFTEFTADCATIDELDQCDPDNIAMVPERLSASDVRVIRKISNPTITGTGIHAEYLKTDKRFWNIKADCGHWNSPDFFRHLADETGTPYDKDHPGGGPRLLCATCHKPFDRFARGEWTAEEKGRVRGYKISKLFSTMVTTTELLARYKEGLANAGAMQRFYNGDLGLPFTASGSKIDVTQLDSCIDAGYVLPNGGKEPSVCGIDTGGQHGDRHNAIVMREGRLLFAGIVHDLKSILDLFTAYNVRVCCIDAAPERRLVKDLQNAHPGTFRVTYLSAKTGETELAKPSLSHGRKISVNRTDSLDAVKEAVVKNKLAFPVNAASLDGGAFYRQMCASTRVYDEDRGQYVWTESEADHYFHACAYALMAEKLWVQIGKLKR